MLYLRKSLFAFLSMLLIGLVSCHDNKQQESNIEEEEGGLSKRERIDRAIEQEFLMTMDPATRTVPRERLLAAQALLEGMQKSRLTGLLNLNWQERGPRNVAGRVRAMFVDRRDASGNTVFSGGVGGGIWRCDNFKSTSATWRLITDKLDNIAVCALAQDPANPNVMYAGTGEGWFNTDAIRGFGIYKSTDGGNTWLPLASTQVTIETQALFSNFDFVQDIVVLNSGVVLATTRSARFCNAGGVLRSADGGTTWSRVIGEFRPPAAGLPNICDSAYFFVGADLEIGGNGDLYATTGFGGTSNHTRGRIWRSPAVGAGLRESWQEITPPGTWERIEIACAPSAPGTLYALLEVDNKIGGIRKTVDNGFTWQNITPPSWCDQGTNKEDFTRGQAWYDLIVQVDPNNANTVLIGGIDLLKSTDGGTSWVQVSQWAKNCSNLDNVHADQHNILYINGSSSEVIASNDGGLYYSSNGGNNWSPRVNDHNITQFYTIDHHPTLPDYFLGGTQDNGTQQFTTPGINNTKEVTGGDGAFAHVDQQNGQVQVSAVPYNNFFYTRDAWATQAKITGNEEGFFINPTDYDDVLGRLYSSNGIRTGANVGNKIGIVANIKGPGAATFNTIDLPGLGNRVISAIKVDPTVGAGGTAWVAAVRFASGSDAGAVPILLKLTNLGTLTPTVAITANLPAQPGSNVSSIDIDPNNANRLLVTLSNYGITSVFETLDRGTNWTAIEGNLPDMPVRWGMIVPASISVNGTSGGGILLGTEVGVWYTPQSAGAGTVWTPQNNSLPNTRIDMIKLRMADATLQAATHGRGLFTTTLTRLTTGIDPVPNTPGFINYISATANRLYIKTGNAITPRMRVAFFDAKGRRVGDTDLKYADQYVDITFLARGMYVVKISGNKGEIYSQKILK
jgi:photosystem II stability/assembly factor-like uncharacterized protein